MADFLHLKTQHQHAARKQEKEHEKLKVRFAKVVGAKTEYAGMKLLNIDMMPKRPAGKRGQWADPNRAEATLHKQISAKLMDRISELEEENEFLRSRTLSLDGLE